MARISEVGLTNVRCFAGTQRARMGRITLLVGENSSGKSTFLGCYHVLAKLANLHQIAEENHFDADPFRMGGFATIARDGCDEFGISAEFVDHVHKSLSFVFENRRGMPVDRKLRVSVPESEEVPGNDLTFVRPSDGSVALRTTGPRFTFELSPSEITYYSIARWLANYVRDGHLPFAGDADLFRKRTGEGKKSTRYAAFAQFADALRRFAFPDPSTFATVPPRAQLPDRQRVYSGKPPGIDPDAAGLLAFLNDMGRGVGLWDGVQLDPTRDGRGTSIVVHKSGRARNLIDVGYGVHSLLVHLFPFLHHPPENAVFLLQQPEVHVHPRAQAALAQWMAESGLEFAIETHSDHLVDRFRICVMNGTLDPDDLSILYFDPSDDGSMTTIHSISVDADGNLDGAPDGYRRFFVQETHRLLGFE